MNPTAEKGISKALSKRREPRPLALLSSPHPRLFRVRTVELRDQLGTQCSPLQTSELCPQHWLLSSWSSERAVCGVGKKSNRTGETGRDGCKGSGVEGVGRMSQRTQWGKGLKLLAGCLDEF